MASTDLTSVKPVSVADILDQIKNTSNTGDTSSTTTTSAISPVTNSAAANSGLINTLASQQQSANEASLANARDSSVNGYNQQISSLPGQYQPLRDQASYQGAKGTGAINEQMANQGLFNSGRNVSAQTANNTNTASNINSLNTQQQSDKDKLMAAIAQAQSDYNNGVAQSTASTQAQATQNQINQNNTDTQNNINQYNADRQYQLDVANMLGTLNGQQTLAGKQTASSVANTDAQTAYQLLVNEGYPAEQAMKMATAQAQLTGLNLQNDYQSLVNAGYPDQSAANLAQQAATLTSTNLANNSQATSNSYQNQLIQSQLAQAQANTNSTNLGNIAQTIQNQYAPQIAQGQIDASKLSNAYQTLVNAGFTDQRAAELAATYAQIAQGNRQLDIQQQQANTSAYSASKSGSSSSKPTSAEITAANKKDSAQATGEAFQVLNDLANQGKTRSEIMKFYKDNYSTFANGNADMNELYNLIDKSFQWDG